MRNFSIFLLFGLVSVSPGLSSKQAGSISSALSVSRVRDQNSRFDPGAIAGREVIGLGIAIMAATVELNDPAPQAVTVPGTYTTTWVGNSVARGMRHIQQGIDGLAVTPDGTVYTNVAWDEGTYNVTQFNSAGRLITDAGHTAGWGFGGGGGVTANSHYLFITQKVGNEGGHLTDPGTWPPAGKTWFGIGRRLRSDITRAAPFPGAKGGAGDTAAREFLPVDEVPDGKAADLAGLAATDSKLYVADPFNNRIRVYSTADMSLVTDWTGVPRIGHLAVDSAGDVWAIQSAGDGEGPKVLEFSPDGNQRAVISFAEKCKPIDIAIDARGDVLVADAGTDENIKTYDPLRLDETPTRPITTFGSHIDSGPGNRRGELLPGKFLGITGVGVDSEGNIYVSSSPDAVAYHSGHHQDMLEKYSASGDRQWIRFGMQWLDMVSMDPGSPEDVYGSDVHYRMNWDRTVPGSEWSALGITTDPLDFPRDFRTGNALQPLLRRLNGNRLYMFASDQYANGIFIYRFDPAAFGEVAIPSASLTKRTAVAPHAPGGESIWRDANGNGQFDPGEFSQPAQPNEYGDNCWGWFVDTRGDIWQTINTDGDSSRLRRYRLQGFDIHGNPEYSYSAIDTYPIPAPFSNRVNNGLERAFYDASTDAMYLAGYTADLKSDTWGGFRVVARYNHWSSGNRTAAWTLSLPYGPDKTSIALSVAGEYAFIGGMQTRSLVRVYKASDGTYVGNMVPNNGEFKQGDTGWVDVRPFGMEADERPNGEYDIFVEDDYCIKTVIYRWHPPSGGGQVNAMP